MMTLSRFSPRQLLFLLSLAALALLLTACFPDHPQSTFDPAGPVARRQMGLFIILFWAMVIVFFVTEGALIYAVIRFRRRPGQGLLAQVHGNRPLEVAWTIAPFLVVVVVATPVIRDLFYLAQPPPNALEVTVTGHQWWWEFEYPTLGVVTANELHIPVGQPVSLTLKSEDVIHSFWVPKLAGKTDVVPGHQNTMWFQADRADTFYGQCAELCGLAHALMRLRVIAESPQEFQAWARQEKASARVATGPAMAGAELFTSKGCIVCHTVRGTQAAGTIGPDLTHLASRTTIAAGWLDNTPENLIRWLTDPEAVKPGNIMARDALAYKSPAFALSTADISALVTYLRSLE